MRARVYQPWRRRVTLLALLLLGAAGCGGSGLYPVTGRVVFDDGSPLDEGIVICEMQDGTKTVMARGNIQRGGTFRLGTEKPGDGARPGRYRVLVVPRGLNAVEAATRPPIIDRKFERFETSGIELDVTEGPNQLPITVTRPREKRSK